METEKRVIRISVRNLVEFVMRSGDLDNRRLTGARKGRDAGGKPHPIGRSRSRWEPDIRQKSP